MWASSPGGLKFDSAHIRIWAGVKKKSHLFLLVALKTNTELHVVLIHI